MRRVPAINPYEASLVSRETENSHSQRISRVYIAVWGAGFLYPVIAVGSIYFCWLVAWAVKGHLPREMLDDPKNIGGIMDLAYLASVLLILPWPLWTIAGFVVTLFCPIRIFRTRSASIAAFAAFYIATCFLAFGLVTWDPGRVVSWWLD